MTLATRLKNLKRKLGVSQNEIARRLLIDIGYMSRLVNGHNENPSKLFFEKLEELEKSSQLAIASGNVAR